METLLVIATGAAAMMGFSHYALPRLLRRDPHLLERAVTGVGIGILLPVAALVRLAGPGISFLDLLVVCAGAGAGTFAAYLLDWWGGRGEQR